MGHNFEFDVEFVEEGTSAQLSDWSISPDPEPTLYSQRHCLYLAFHMYKKLIERQGL